MNLPGGPTLKDRTRSSVTGLNRRGSVSQKRLRKIAVASAFELVQITRGTIAKLRRLRI